MRLALIIGCVAVFGCSASDDDAPSAASIALVSSTMTSLHVTGDGGFRHLDGGPDADVDVTITNVSAIRGVFTETASLPSADGVRHCRNGLGGVYHLAFSGTAGSVTFDVDPTGCQIVTVNGTPMGTANDPAYWSDLERALGVTLLPKQ